MPQPNKPYKTVLTAKQELFCHAIVQGLRNSEAAIKSGYSKRSAAVQANQNLKDPKIQARITALREQTSKALDITSESQLFDLEAIKQEAGKEKNFSAMISAIIEQNKLLGFHKAKERIITKRTIVKLPTD